MKAIKTKLELNDPMFTKGKYTLDENGEPKPCTDFLEWARWLEDEGQTRVLKQTYFPENTEAPTIKVSTVFLGMDHGFNEYLAEALNLPKPPPVLWETMIFGGDEDMYQDRYSSKQDALRGHDEACELVKASLLKNSGD